MCVPPIEHPLIEADVHALHIARDADSAECGLLGDEDLARRVEAAGPVEPVGDGDGHAEGLPDRHRHPERHAAVRQDSQRPGDLGEEALRPAGLHLQSPEPLPAAGRWV